MAISCDTSFGPLAILLFPSFVLLLIVSYIQTVHMGFLFLLIYFLTYHKSLLFCDFVIRYFSIYLVVLITSLSKVPFILLLFYFVMFNFP